MTIEEQLEAALQRVMADGHKPTHLACSAWWQELEDFVDKHQLLLKHDPSLPMGALRFDTEE